MEFALKTPMVLGEWLEALAVRVKLPAEPTPGVGGADAGVVPHGPAPTERDLTEDS
jgi:hypothetical protein